MLADLHIHTTVSDGSSTPEQVVELAKRSDLQCIAITDHDTMEGIPRALVAAKTHNVEILNGVELSTEDKSVEIHILGYGMDLKQQHLEHQLKIFQNARLVRAEKIIHKLNALGLAIELNQVLDIAGNGSVGRPHIAKALLNQKYIGSVTEAFERYIGLGKPAYEPRYKFHPLQAIELIKNAGGVPVLAHPGISCSKPLVLSLIKAGLQGIEVYHPRHDQQLIKYYLGLCFEYQLIATGGSDFHGVGITGHGKLGDVVVPYTTVTELKELAAHNRHQN